MLEKHKIETKEKKKVLIRNFEKYLEEIPIKQKKETERKTGLTWNQIAENLRLEFENI